MQENESPIIVGRINGVYGVRGWVKVESYTRPRENIFTYSHWLVRVNNRWQEIAVEEFQQRGSGRFCRRNQACCAWCTTRRHRLQS